MLNIHSFLLENGKKYSAYLASYLTLIMATVIYFNPFQLNVFSAAQTAYEYVCYTTQSSFAAKETEQKEQIPIRVLKFVKINTNVLEPELLTANILEMPVTASEIGMETAEAEQVAVIESAMEEAEDVGLELTVGEAVSLSDAERAVLERIVQAEAGSEDIYGKMLVANVVLNRVNNERFPDTVEKVVLQRTSSGYQFSPAKSGGRYWTVTVSDETKDAVSRVLSGEDYSDGALYFAAREKANKANMDWFDRNLTRLFAYGGHEFFKQ